MLCIVLVLQLQGQVRRAIRRLFFAVRADYKSVDPRLRSLLRKSLPSHQQLGQSAAPIAPFLLMGVPVACRDADPRWPILSRRVAHGLQGRHSLLVLVQLLLQGLQPQQSVLFALQCLPPCQPSLARDLPTQPKAHQQRHGAEQQALRRQGPSVQDPPMAAPLWPPVGTPCPARAHERTPWGAGELSSKVCKSHKRPCGQRQS